jgi:hypothetical protein
MLTETRFLHLRKQHSRTAVAAIALGHCGSLLECERGKIQRYVCGSTARELESCCVIGVPSFHSSFLPLAPYAEDLSIKQ